MSELDLDDLFGGIYFEDVSVNLSREYGSYTVDKDEVISFGKQYTLHPAHTDPEAAEDSPFGGLIASGIQTLTIAARLIAEYDDRAPSTLGGMGIDELRWYQPVYPGDSLSVSSEVTEKQPWDR